MKNKIFGLGIGRTATKSLTSALSILGYDCLHWAPDLATALEVTSGSKVSRITEQKDAIIDTILPLLLVSHKFSGRWVQTDLSLNQSNQ